MDENKTYLGFGVPWITVIVIFSLAVSLITGQPVFYAIKFSLFQIFAVLIPGIALIKMLGIDDGDVAKCIGLSYFIGYCTNIFIYLGIAFLKLYDYVAVVVFLEAFVSIIYLISSYRKGKAVFIFKKNSFGSKVCMGFLLVYLCGSFVAYTLGNVIPPLVDANVVNGDVTYWIGNTIELTKEFPPKNFRSYPQPYNYHYFSSIQIAFTSLATGISPVALSIYYHNIQPIMLIVFGGYLVFKEYAKRNISVIIGMVMLIFTSGMEKVSVVTYREHMFDNPFSFDYGMGLFLFFLYFLMKIYHLENFSWRYCIVTLGGFACLMGTKAPFAVVALAGMGISSLWWLLQKKYKKAFLAGLPTLILFIIIYFSVVNVKGYSGGNITSIVTQSSPADRISAAAVTDSGIVLSVLNKMIVFIFYGITSNPTIFLVLTLTLGYCILRRKRLESGSVTLLFMTIVAEVISLFIGMNGNSQMYFIMAAFPICILIYVMNADEVYKSTVYKVLLTLLLIVGIWCWNKGYAGSFTELCVNNINKILYNDEVDMKQNYSISVTQVEAYEWLKKQAEWDTQVYSNKGDGLIGIFSECYVHGGTELFEMTSEETQNEYIEQIKAMNCEYIVYDIAKAENFEMKSEMCTQVFENESTIIYQIMAE